MINSNQSQLCSDNSISWHLNMICAYIVFIHVKGIGLMVHYFKNIAITIDNFL